MKRLINVTFGKYSDAGFENKANHIIASLEDNAVIFDQPFPTVPDLKIAGTAYTKALTEAANRGKNEVAAKNAARLSLENMLEQEGMYVMNRANGDLTILTLSGYDLRKVKEPRHISTPGAVSVSNGISTGELTAGIASDSGAVNYVHDVTDDYKGEATAWKSISTGTCKYTHTDLQPGRQYWFRVGVVGPRGQFAYSPVANKYAQ